MKLGFGLYRHRLDEEYFRYAPMCGATHLVVQMTEYFGALVGIDQPVGDARGWGRAGHTDLIWSTEELSAPCAETEEHGIHFRNVRGKVPIIRKVSLMVATST